MAARLSENPSHLSLTFAPKFVGAEDRKFSRQQTLLFQHALRVIVRADAAQGRRFRQTFMSAPHRRLNVHHPQIAMTSLG